MDLPTTIRSIRQPNWTDTLSWVTRNGWSMAEVDHDWRVWVREDGKKAVVRNKGDFVAHDFPDLPEALASLDYRADA